MGRGSGMWSGFIQSLLVALAVFSFTQLWTRKENNQQIREALFDMRSEIIHNDALIADGTQNLEQLQDFQIGPEYPFAEGLQTQSLQRNLVLVAQQDVKLSDNLVKYYSDLDALKIDGERQLAELAAVDREVQYSKSLLSSEMERRDNFMINQDKIQSRYPMLLNDAQRTLEALSRTNSALMRNQQKIQAIAKERLLGRLKEVSGEQKVALDTIDVMDANLNIRDVHLYGYMAYLLLFFLFISLIPSAMGADKEKWLAKRGVEVGESITDESD